MSDEVIRLRDELRAAEAQVESWRISSAAAVLSCSRMRRQRDEDKKWITRLETALSSILCASGTVLMGEVPDGPTGDVQGVLAGISRTAATALGLYDPESETSGRDW